MSRRSKPSDNVEQILMEGDKRNNFISKKKCVPKVQQHSGEKQNENKQKECRERGKRLPIR